jgi:hypothetical protein
MRLTRNLLRKLIIETVRRYGLGRPRPDSAFSILPDTDPEVNIIRVIQNLDQPGRRLLERSLYVFYQLVKKLDSIYDHHRSYDRADDEASLIRHIDSSRKELYRMGIKPGTLNDLKELDYDEFDDLMMRVMTGFPTR